MILALLSACTAGPHQRSAWERIDSLEGFVAHDATVRDGALWIVGEDVSDVAAPSGALLKMPLGGDRASVVARFPQAAHLRSIAFDPRGVGYLTGDTKRGDGLLLTGSDRTWRPLRLPAGVSELDAASSVSGVLWSIGEAGEDGIVLRDGVPLARLRGRSGRHARLSTMSDGQPVAIGGTDGVNAVVFNGATFDPIAPNADVTGLAVQAGTTYATIHSMNGIGALLRRSGKGQWDAMPTAIATNITSPIPTPDGVAVLASTERGVEVFCVPSNRCSAFVSADAGSVEALVPSPDGTIFGVGAGGIYRGRL